MRRLLRVALVAGAAGFAALFLAVVAAAERVETRHGAASPLDPPVDALIVLGAGIDFDRRLDAMSRRRAAGAAKALAAGEAKAAIFTGTLGGLWPPLSAGGLMRDHAAEMGVDPARLFVEPEARSTFENLRFSFRIAEREGFETLAIVSDPYHLTRAYWLAAYLGRPDVRLRAAPGMAHAWWWTNLGHLLRETLAWPYNLYKVAAWEALGAAGLETRDREELVW